MRIRRVVVRTFAVLLALALLISAYVVVQVSREVTELLRVPSALWPSQVRVVEATGRQVTIEQVDGGPTWLTVGTVYGLAWETGSGQVGQVVVNDGERVQRRFRLLEGTLPAPGTLARYSREAYPRDATRAFPGLEVQELTIPGGAGDLPAWFVPGDRDTWAILVHGRGSARSEMFRLMHSAVAAGLPSLAMTYRNAPETGGGLTELGLSEWRDVEAAVRVARDRGARDVVLMGASMGGTLIASFLERSELARHVRAIVLDSPLFDLRATVHDAVGGAGVPKLLSSAGLRLAQWRSGVDLAAVAHLDDTSWLTAPALVWHGTSDDSVPVETSRRLAEAAPDLVTLHLVEGAGHVEAWNFAPKRYDRQVRKFLRAHAR
ncbi:alpha/beta hydrolase family protein [Nocardioides massiliensis]|uniref:Pimeloyl-ACP methyl ester carboxylesterase n=1 Tax=Nocardioides massiliensis TaxID=1325935 RepID=A0ABT9NMU8_9ACTN|nr:alpha/beta hydrolase [Nocardioides massiliensis]MDP9821751.1 pimeloyl-ACP methyl ester carboxylesterase [Nocardioides massiliensis]